MESKFLTDNIHKGMPDALKKAFDLFGGREKDVVLLSSLVVASNCLPNLYGYYGNNKCYANFYILIIAPAASGKGVMNYTRKLIEPIHKKLLDDSNVKRNKVEKQKKKTSKLPSREITIIPANSSSTEVYKMIANSSHGTIIIDSEADTLTTVLKNDWGNHSDLLSKAFHHENLSIKRQDEDLYSETLQPKLSIAISGTPGQVAPLLKSTENGLFSRFTYYKFSDFTEWKDVFESQMDFNSVFEEIGQQIMYPIYGKLLKRSKPLKFRLTDTQIKLFNIKMKECLNLFHINLAHDFAQCVKRHGIICFRICMILSALNNSATIDTLDELVCSDDDFETALAILEVQLSHTFCVFNEFKTKSLSMVELSVLSKLDECFLRKDLIVIAKDEGVSERTVDNKLKQWETKGVIQKLAHGKYQKVKM